MRSDPFQRCQNAGQRSGEALHRIGDHGQAEAGETLRITIGVENETVALGRDPGDGAGDEGAPANLAQRLVAAAHAAGEAPGEQHAEGRRMACLRRHAQSSALLRRWRALSSST